MEKRKGRKKKEREKKTKREKEKRDYSVVGVSNIKVQEIFETHFIECPRISREDFKQLHQPRKLQSLDILSFNFTCLFIFGNIKALIFV